MKKNNVDSAFKITMKLPNVLTNASYQQSITGYDLLEYFRFIYIAVTLEIDVSV